MVECTAFEYGYLKRFAYIQMSTFLFAILAWVFFLGNTIAILVLVLLNAVLIYAYVDVLSSRRNCKNNHTEMSEFVVIWRDNWDSYSVEVIDSSYFCDTCKKSFRSHTPNFCSICGSTSFKLQDAGDTKRYYGLTTGYVGIIALIGGFFALELYGIYGQSLELLLCSFIFPAVLGGVIMIDSKISMVKKENSGQSILFKRDPEAGMVPMIISNNLNMVHLDNGIKMRKIRFDLSEHKCNECGNIVFFKNDGYCKNCGRERQ